MDRDIQPRTVPEILDAGFRLYRRHFWLLLGLSFATTLPFPESYFHHSFGGGNSNADIAAAMGKLGMMMISLLITMVLSTLKGWLVTAALTEPLLGRPASLKATLDRFVPSLPALVLRLLVFTILGMLASSLLLVPGVLLYLAWLFYSEVVIVEGRGVPAFRRSAELTKGQRGRIGILITLAGLVVGALSLAFSVTGELLRLPLAEQACSYLALLLLGPLQSAILLVAYFDLRARREGLDLKLRSQALDASSSAPAAVVGAA